MPLVRVWAAAILAGAAAGVMGTLTPGAAWAAALGLVSLAIAVPWRLAWRGLLVGALCAASAAHSARARDETLAPPLLQWFAGHDPPGDLPVLIDGRLLSDAQPSPAGGVRLEVAVGRVRTGDSWQDVAGPVQLHVAGDVALSMIDGWTRGRRVQAMAALRRPQMLRNPGSPDQQWQRLIRGFVLVGTVKSGALVHVEPGGWWDERAAAVRRYVRHATRLASGGRDPVAAAIIAAVLIGDRAGLDPDTIRRLQDAGTYHVVAISGGNVALVMVVVLVVLRLSIRSLRWISVVAVFVVVGYGWVVGEQPSVDRAVAAACVYLAADMAGLLIAPLDVLGAVVTGLVLLDPVMVVEPAAWLSCGATAGILVGAGTAPRPSLARVSGLKRWIVRGGAWGLAMFKATLAAELVLVPIGAGVFLRVSAAGLILNFVAIPAMAVIQGAGILIVLLSGWAEHATALPARIAEWACAGLLGSARLVDAAPWLVCRVPPPDLTVTVAFYAAAIVAVGAKRPAVKALSAASVGVLLIMIVTAPTLEWAAPDRSWLRVAVVDVGQGDGLLVQFPGGQSMAIDAGAASETFDVGERVVVPAAWALGIRRLTWIAFTHADLDHIGGTISVARILKPREVWDGVPVAGNPEWRALRAEANRQGLPWRQVRRGDLVDVGGVQIDVVNPPPPDWERQRVRNDDSIIVRLRYGDVEMLLTGDAGVAAESELAVGLDPSRIRILKVGHHGSRTSSSPAFVQAYHPAAALVSVGRGNPFGHPAADVLARFTRQGADVFRTDRDGAIIVETDGREIVMKTWSGRIWSARLAPPPS